jgi:hypothetical protein
MSRTPVTPLAIKSGRVSSVVVGKRDVSLVKKAWTCMSQRPGMTYIPVPSITVPGWTAPGRVSLERATLAIRFPSTVTVMSGESFPLTTSTTVTCSMVTVCAASGVPNARAPSAATSVRSIACITALEYRE